MIHRKNSVLFVLLACTAAAWGTPKADAVLEWNEIMLTTLTGYSPLDETRVAAITQLAVFEAVNAVTARYHPYLGTLDAKQNASAEAAAIAAAHASLIESVPARKAELDAARAKSLASIADGPSKNDGIALGEAAAKKVIELRINDGSAVPEFYKPASPTPGAWQLTPSCSDGVGVGLHMGNVRPFGIRSSKQFRAAPPPRLTSRRYAKAYDELRRVGGELSTERPQDRSDVARFYAVVLAIRTWNPVARQVAMSQGRSISENARDLALLNMAMSDALVSVFETKYHATLWRPETAIRAGDRDGNRATRGDRDFVPFVVTPCHPSYPSAHASAAHAARAVLERSYGCNAHAIKLASAAIPEVVLEYRHFDEITDDIDDARIFGGIHFRFDQEAGARQGRRVGEYVYDHNLQPIYKESHTAERFGRGRRCKLERPDVKKDANIS